ncbi:unnamed protein product [Phytophthora fragariaefolia]|uniref:Unnamed protein product n=1 Tax=Phytophthora fragariaefolia TaxID=1490495 RepID=A0A9W7CQ49_9STRA|nr:unnamed protein product [Phytophthora fragariaefolia]
MADTGRDKEGNANEQDKVPAIRTRVEALVNSISQYQDIYPVLQRGIELLHQTLSDEATTDEIIEEADRSIEVLFGTGALEGTVRAMVANLDSPAFILSCFKLLLAMLKPAGNSLAEALWKTGMNALETTLTAMGITMNVTNYSENSAV